MSKPAFPARQQRPLGLGQHHFGYRGEHFGQLLLQPGMQHRVRGVGHPFRPNLAGRWPKEGEQLGGTVPDVFVGLACRLADQLPTRTGIGHCLVGTRFVLAPELQSNRLRQTIRLLDQSLFSSVFGSTTVTTPLFRTRWAVPVGHQLRVRW